ncbi:hypothetical protein HCG49_16735 [Arenibacter sp. 6A1]|uniref:hypothetical protein n=1 Tax=Arenibacter sp. 6A1 TaxID=2720391 RepID=UPI001446E114|nr:hypothetical protein [Arenibacter sp. 6A1]NKI28201.1 hypothetical protein [Arenibacter sp. 6A1]
MKLHSFYLLLTIALFYSCNKDSSIKTEDRASAIMGQWEYESVTTDRAVDMNGDGNYSVDLYNTQEMRQCLKDNLTFFTEGGMFSINENGLACDDNDPYINVLDDIYSLEENNTIIRFQNGKDQKIMSLDKSNLVTEIQETINDELVTVTTTYKRS